MANQINIRNVFNYAPYAAVFACGTAVGYTLNATGNPISNALITTGCGISRAISVKMFHHPHQKHMILGLAMAANAQGDTKALETHIAEGDLLGKNAEIANVFYKASWAFSMGIVFGTATSGESVLSGLLNGGLIHTVGLFSEVLPVIATRESKMQFDETTGKQI